MCIHINVYIYIHTHIYTYVYIYMKIRLHAFRKLVWGENVEKHGFCCFSGGEKVTLSVIIN